MQYKSRMVSHCSKVKVVSVSAFQLLRRPSKEAHLSSGIKALVDSMVRIPLKQHHHQQSQTQYACPWAPTGKRVQTPLPNKQPNLQLLVAQTEYIVFA